MTEELQAFRDQCTFQGGRILALKKRIADLHETILAISGEWQNLKLTCQCDATKNEACSICEITLTLTDWQHERDGEGPQE